jgi:hypothetical protein
VSFFFSCFRWFDKIVYYFYLNSTFPIGLCVGSVVVAIFKKNRLLWKKIIGRCGISLGGSLSPLMGALYLKPLDDHWRNCGSMCYLWTIGWCVPGVVKILFFLQKVDPIFIPFKKYLLKKTIIYKLDFHSQFIIHISLYPIFTSPVCTPTRWKLRAVIHVVNQRLNAL